MLDYKKLGLRVGLEIHQQLNSGSKLFCRCPIVKSEEFPLEVRRKMVPVQSEMGEDDPATLFEYLRNRTFIYRFSPESSCLVELDESPPLAPNQSALRMVIQLSRLLNCTFLDEVYFMRKTVIDGSSVSGFQRTGLIATDGSIETSLGTVGIQTISLEEDSAPAISKGESVEYRLDRLGTPLIEIATDASISSPAHAKETAEKIGTLLRSVDVVRGIGSIRQDVNVSIENGARCEIKGFQELEKIPDLIDNEVKRQVSLLEIRDELRKRGFDGAKNNAKDVTKLFAHTKCNFVRKAVDEGKHVHALKIEKFANLLARPCGDRTFGRELSAYPASHGFGIIHSDEDLAKYNLAGDFAALRDDLGAEEEDLVLITVGNGVEKAVDTLVKRINYCMSGVPEETRVADGIGSRYARPLPGSGRLYPESDVPAVKLTNDLMSVEKPKTLEERRKELDLPEQLAEQIVRDKYYGWFSETRTYGTMLAANLFLSNFKDVSRKGYDVSKIKLEDLHVLLKEITGERVPKNAITDILIELCTGVTIENAIKKYGTVSDSELKDVIRAAIHENKGATDSALIGVVLSRVRADGRKVAQLIKELRK